MTAAELVLVVAAVLGVIVFAALVVVLLRVLDALRDVRRELDDLQARTEPLIQELQDTTDEARATVNEARADLERFDRVLGSAEAIGDAVGATVARGSFSAPAIKAVGIARGTSRTIARLRGTSRTTTRPTIASVSLGAIDAAPSGRRAGRRRSRSA